MTDHDFNPKLPFITSDIKGTGGKIKEKNEDFVVEEVPLYEACGTGTHLYVNLTREGMTTRDVQKQLAELFNVDPSKVGFAGMKDKHARTTQTFSIETGKADENEMDDFLEDVSENINQSLSVIVNWCRMHTNKIKAGHLIGNRFVVKIGSFDKNLMFVLETSRAVIKKLGQVGMPNFYGPQRFGINKDNAAKGFDIVKNYYKPDDRWLRKLLVSSYQSHLCNLYLAKRIESGGFDKILEGDIAKKHETGGLFVVEDAIKEQPRYENKEISFTAPIYGTEMMPTKGPSSEMEAQVLNEAGITMEQLSKAGAGGTRRLGRVLISNVDVKLIQDWLELKFFLPKGAFATTLIREITKTEL